MDVKNKRVVVTGAASGIGKALCEAFYQAEAQSVIAVDMNLDGAQETADSVNGIAIQANVGNEKDIINVIKKADELFRENLEGKIHAHKLYSLLLEQIPNIYEKKKERILRGNLRQKIWDCERTYFWNEKYASQAGQDKIIKDFFFRNKDNGYFVDIGAYDGIMGSNSLHFERFLKWNGVAVEPSEIQFKKLKENRSCKIINKAISSTVKEVEFMDVVEGLTQMSGINNEIYKKYNSNL